MSKQIIIDWQRDGLFVAAGSRRGNNVSIETLLTTGGDGSANGSSTAISTQLYALAKQFDLHKAEATVIAPREVLEFRTLTVPRGEANEIPDMVRFQAQRQMANIGDTWALDYILLPEQPGQEGVSALAATISPAHMAEIEATCSDLGIHLTRVLARPLEIARWGVAVGGLATTEVGMVIALSQTHADLLLVSLGNLIQLRGTRLPEEPAAATATLVAEIRRSILAAASYVSNRAVSKILLIAAPELAERAEATIAQATGASVAVIDPASMLPASLPERHEIAQRSANRLAAIAGVLGNPSPDKRDVIDLKNVKRREAKKSKKRETILAGSITGVLALMGIYWWWSANSALDSEIATARKTEAQLKEISTVSSKFLKHRKDVDKFLAGSINWLDELAYVAKKLPPADQVMLSDPTLAIAPDNSGIISVTLDAKDAETISLVQQELTDKRHAVSGSGSQKRPSKNGDYTWTDKETIHITAEGWDPLAVKQKPTKPAPAPAATTPEPSQAQPAPQPAATAPLAEAAAPATAASQPATAAAAAALPAATQAAGSQPTAPPQSSAPQPPASQPGEPAAPGAQPAPPTSDAATPSQPAAGNPQTSPAAPASTPAPSDSAPEPAPANAPAPAK